MKHTSLITEEIYGYYSPAPFIAGLISIAQWCPHNWFGKQLALVLRKLVLFTGRQPVDTAVGSIRIRCYLNDNVSERKFLFLPWLFDPEEKDLISNKLPDDGIFIDIGANVGIYSLWACQKLSSRGTVIAIEPYPPIYERLIFNLRVNQETDPDWPQVITLPVAISNQEGMIDLNLDETNLGGNSIVYHQGSSHKVQVQSRLLLSVLSEAGIENIDILKIDIEGAEDLALMPFLDKAEEPLLPKYIIIEDTEHQWQSDLESAIRMRGYEVEFKSRMNSVYRFEK